VPSPDAQTPTRFCVQGREAVLWSERVQGLNCGSSPSDPTELRQRAMPGNGSVSRWDLSTSRYLTARRHKPRQLQPRGRSELFVLGKFRGISRHLG
jgi:hypothetical protein